MRQHRRRSHGQAGFFLQGVIPDPIAGMAVSTVPHPATGRIIAVQLELDNQYARKGEPQSSPFFQFAVSSRKRRALRVFSGDAHRESGVFSYRSALSPVESCSPPELCELTPHIYS